MAAAAVSCLLSFPLPSSLAHSLPPAGIYGERATATCDPARGHRQACRSPEVENAGRFLRPDVVDHHPVSPQRVRLPAGKQAPLFPPTQQELSNGQDKELGLKGMKAVKLFTKDLIISDGTPKDLIISDDLQVVAA